MDYQRPYLICCGILKKEIEKLIEDSKLPVEPLFLDPGLHIDYDELKEKLTKAIEECSKDGSRAIIVVYGDLCHPQMKEMISKYDNVVKVDALNCIDCLLGGHGKLLDIDPTWDYFYISPGWLPSNLKKSSLMSSFSNRLSDEHRKAMFSCLKGVIVLDTLGDLDGFKGEIEEFASRRGLPIASTRRVGLEGLKDLITEAIQD